MVGNKNTILVSLLALIMVFTVVLAGCSGGDQNSTEQSGSETADSGTTDTETETPEAETPKTPKEKVEITFWHVWSEKDSAHINARVEVFNELQDEIHVKVLGNQDSTKQLTAISGGNPPDIALTFWNNIGPWADAGAVLPLTQYFEKDRFDTGAYIPAAMERMKVNDEYYALPFTMSMASTLMYNKKAFADAGLKEPPETLEDLFAYAKKLTKRDADGNITQIGFMPDYPWIDTVFWPVIFGGRFVDESGNITSHEAANVQAIEYQQMFYKEFGAEAIGKFRSGMGQRGTPNDPLLTGTLAMMIAWEYNFPVERGEEGPLGIAPFPYPADKPELKGSGIVSPRAVFIPKKAKHPDEAWTFMKWLLSGDQQIKYSLTGNTIPTVAAALEDPRLKEHGALETMQYFFDRAKGENLTGFPNSTYINDYLTALFEETDKALKGQQSAQEAMDKAVERIQPLADKAKK